MNELFASNPKKLKSILVVDDAPDILFLVETVLQEAGYDVKCAENGYSALAQVQQQQPDLIVLDVMMPGMSGYGVIRQIRQHSEFSKIPILLMTACDSVMLSQQANDSADAIIYKPLELDELLVQVNELLNKDRITSWIRDEVQAHGGNRMKPEKKVSYLIQRKTSRFSC